MATAAQGQQARHEPEDGDADVLAMRYRWGLIVLAGQLPRPVAREVHERDPEEDERQAIVDRLTLRYAAILRGEHPR